MAGHVHENDISAEKHPDRRSKDLIGGSSPVKTTSGFSIGVAEYILEDFGTLQIHEDQEAAYVVSGVGEMTVAGEIVPLKPGTAVSIPPGAPHATRRTGPTPVKLIYAHGAV